MNQIVKYNCARLEIENCFSGLPHAHTTLIKSLISKADPETGIIDNISYRDLALLLTVNHAPGRKGAGIPKKETIRSYLRTIADNHPSDFKLFSEGQKLKCQFLALPKIYAKFFDFKKEYTVERMEGDKGYVLENTDDLLEKDNPLDMNKNPEHPEAECENEAVKNIYIFNKLNKQTNCKDENLKKPISPNFQPNQETINFALDQGLKKVLDANEIKKFITHNQTNQSLWEDFNPVFIRWLECEENYSLKKINQKSTKTQGNSRRSDHARSTPTHKFRTYAEAMAAVKAANPNPLSPSELFPRS